MRHPLRDALPVKGKSQLLGWLWLERLGAPPRATWRVLGNSVYILSMNGVTLRPRMQHLQLEQNGQEGQSPKPRILWVVLNSDTVRQHPKPQAGELVRSHLLPLCPAWEADRVLE